MKILVIVLSTLFILSLIVIAYSKYDYQNYIKKYANKYTIEEINNIIQKDNAILEKEKQYDRLTEYENQCINRAFNLFKSYFGSLWI